MVIRWRKFRGHSRTPLVRITSQLDLSVDFFLIFGLLTDFSADFRLAVGIRRTFGQRLFFGEGGQIRRLSDVIWCDNTCGEYSVSRASATLPF